MGENREIENYRKGLIEYNKEDEISPDNSNDEYLDSLIDKIIEASDFNNKINLKRSVYLFNTKRFIVISFIFSFVAFLINFLIKII